MHKTPEITRLIHANFWTVLSFALARPAASRLIEERFGGEWKYLRRTIQQHAEVRADRALLEMATQLRVLDDAEGLSDYLRQAGGQPLGTVTQADGSTTDLHFRDMTNKVMHAASFEWQFAEEPSVVCYPRDPKRWKSAEIWLLPLMGFVGMLMV
jgi:hypothetical protein